MMDKRAILNGLRRGEIDLQGQFLRGSNGTFLVIVQNQDHSIQAVYKPEAGEQPLWDFPVGTLGKRELATYLFDEALEWELVPPTIYRKEAPLGPGSLQFFIPHDPENHYFQLSPSHEDTLQKVLLFDFMLNNADRKAGHFILDADNHIWLIDHGLTFNAIDKLRTVAWDHAGENIPPELLTKIKGVHDGLETKDEIYLQLSSLLSMSELTALSDRMKTLLKNGCYPIPPSDRRVIPWPPI